MAHIRAVSTAELMGRAKHALPGITDERLGQIIGFSRRTMSRYGGRPRVLTRVQLEALARAVFPHDRALAADIAKAIASDLVKLGLEAPAVKIEAPPAPPPPPAEKVVALHPRLAKAVLCAAAQAGDVSPNSVRPMLYAAFRCAREIGLDVATVEAGLATEEKAAPAAPIARERRST